MDRANKKILSISKEEINDRKNLVHQCMSDIGSGVIDETTRCLINDYISGKLSDSDFRESVLKILSKKHST